MNYKRLVEAQNYYERFGFKPIDVPWTVPNDIVTITLPKDGKPYRLVDTYLVGSAEQSFLYLMSENLLPKGSYSAITPCFRDDVEDWLHQKYFMKLELIETKDVNVQALRETVDLCKAYFEQFIATKVVKTPEGYDIETYNGIELGSYGIRSHYLIGDWIYATGLAEPRLTIALQGK